LLDQHQQQQALPLPALSNKQASINSSSTNIMNGVSKSMNYKDSNSDVTDMLSNRFRSIMNTDNGASTSLKNSLGETSNFENNENNQGLKVQLL
jgi:hypothetical protein